VETALDEAHAAEKSGELERAAACLDRALRWELAERIPQVRALSAEELFDRARGDRERALVLLLQRLDRARFGPQPDLPELRSVRVAFTSWRDEARRGSPSA
jgi:hypothetical protein